MADDQADYAGDPICPECKCCEMTWVTCWDCGGEGIHDDLYEQDPLWYDPGDYEDCDTCQGMGGWHVCGHCHPKALED